MRLTYGSASLLAILFNAPTAQCKPQPSDIKPDHASAKTNAYDIFNAIHSVGRQWGSAAKHNGFALFPAIMPAGTLLYHGGCNSAVPAQYEWLAFEVEHAAGFSSSKMKGPGQPGRRDPDQQSQSQKPLGGKPSKQKWPFPCPGDDLEYGNLRGYLHTYQLERDARLLYVDGLSAGKSDFGMLDTQDFLLREGETAGLMDEGGRAEDICKILKQWGWDGFVRSELGFEVIYCDFTVGIRRVSLKRTYFHTDKLGKDELLSFQWARAVGERYDDIGGGRLQIDYSSMVSGHFYPINISIWDPDRPDLKRLGSAKMEDLLAIKKDASDIMQGPRRFNVNWRDEVDMIITRFSEGIVTMSEPDLSDIFFIAELERAILNYIDAPAEEGDVNAIPHQKAKRNETEDAIKDCKEHWLLHATANRDRWSNQDKFIHTALKAVVGDICDTYFDIRRSLLIASGNPNSYTIEDRDDKTATNSKDLKAAVKRGRESIHQLMLRLEWTEWLKTRRCPIGETMIIAMWPMGNNRDHFRPGCRSASDISQPPHDSYWWPQRGPPRE